MKFILEATSEWYQEGTEDVLKEKYGEILGKHNWVREYSNEDENINVIEISDLEDLLEFQKEIGHNLILCQESDVKLPEIEIYDDYRE